MIDCALDVDTKWIFFLSKLLSVAVFLMASNKKLDRCVCIDTSTNGGGTAPYLPGWVGYTACKGVWFRKESWVRIVFSLVLDALILGILFSL